MLTSHTYLSSAFRRYLVGRPAAEYRLAQPLIRAWGQRYLVNITARLIVLYRCDRLKQGAARTTVNKEVQLLRRMMRDIAGLTIELRTLSKKPRRTKLRRAQIDSILEKAGSRPEWVDGFAQAALYALTGLRRRELRRIRWADVDPWNEQINFGGRTYRFYKNKWVRKALIALEQRRMRAPGRCRTSDFVLQASPKDSWLAIRKAAGFPDITLRDLRVISEATRSRIRSARQRQGQLSPPGSSR